MYTREHLVRARSSTPGMPKETESPVWSVVGHAMGDGGPTRTSALDTTGILSALGGDVGIPIRITHCNQGMQRIGLYKVFDTRFSISNFFSIFNRLLLLLRGLLRGHLKGKKGGILNIFFRTKRIKILTIFFCS